MTFLEFPANVSSILQGIGDTLRIRQKHEQHVWTLTTLETYDQCQQNRAAKKFLGYWQKDVKAEPKFREPVKIGYQPVVIVSHGPADLISFAELQNHLFQYESVIAVVDYQELLSHTYRIEANVLSRFSDQVPYVLSRLTMLGLSRSLPADRFMDSITITFQSLNDISLQFAQAIHQNTRNK